MKIETLCLCLLLTGVTGSVSAGQSTDLQQAREAVAAFAAALKSELVAAMKAGGPTEAIGVCNIKAPEISQALSLEKGMQISRVSSRNRNPGNAPNAWQTVVLDSFEHRLKAGEDADALTWNETVTEEGMREFRFMKAIPTATICLQCHGQSIAPEVVAKLNELYPEDRATGFREGDLRGAFVVTRSLD